MTGKVWIDIKGIQTVDGERELVEEAGPGDYYARNGKHYVIGSGDGCMVKCIKFAGDFLTVVRNDGGSEMVFEKGRETRVLYNTPVGNLALEIRTRDFSLCEEDERFEVKVKYSLHSDGIHISDNCMEIKVYPRKA